MVTVIMVHCAVIASGCNKSQTFTNYSSCVTQKKSEYIDAGANGWEGVSRAEAFCETKYPLLQPSYQSIQDVTIKVNHDTRYCAPEIGIYCTYTFHLSRPVDLVTFSISNQNGFLGSFKNVEPYDQKITWRPEEAVVGGPVISAEVIEALVDVNKGKHEGD